jgi:3-hydroxyacyl-CoA dehydrogenase / 3-hydroxy-2-methylbutyryl-CoA dehydrogenase
MRLEGLTALVSGGASGLGEGTARLLTERGARVAIVDLNGEAAGALADELGAGAESFRADVTAEDELRAAIDGTIEAFGELRLVVGCAGIAWGERVVGREGAAKLAPFENVVAVNLVGMFNLLRLGAAAMSENPRDDEGQRGAVVMTASIAAFEGQTGQIAYAASKAGVAGMTLPAARDLASVGIRVCTIAPGLFDTPLLAGLPQKARDSLGAGTPFPRRLGRPSEYAQLVAQIAENPMLNGETIRLDGALRMPPR